MSEEEFRKRLLKRLGSVTLQAGAVATAGAFIYVTASGPALAVEEPRAVRQAQNEVRTFSTGEMVMHTATLNEVGVHGESLVSLHDVAMRILDLRGD